MRRFVLYSLILLTIPLQLVYLYAKNGNNDLNNVAGIQTRQVDSVLNWVGIGEFRFTLFGYTSPFAAVTLNGQGIFDQTISDSTGYFEFENRFSPFSPREACLSSKDQFGRISSPVCLPPFPTAYNVSIGPVLVPPTISLNKEIYYIDDEVVLSGQTIPKSKVNLSVFTKEATLPSLSFVKSANAFTFPKLDATSDEKGNFSISLPSGNPEAFRIFAQTGFDDKESGESIKLNFDVYPIWMVIVRFFLLLINAIKSRLLEIIIAAEIIYLGYAFFQYWLNPYKRSRRAIILRESEPIMIMEEHPLVKT